MSSDNSEVQRCTAQATTPGNSEDKESPQLTVDSYEGGSRLYTISIVTCAALWLVLVEAEHGLFDEQQEGELIVTQNFVYNFLILVVWSILDGFLSFLALLPNLKFQKGHNVSYMRAYAVIAFVSLVAMNAATGTLVYRTHVQFVRRYKKVKIHYEDPDLEQGNSISKEAHFFLIVATLSAVVFADTQFFCKVFIRYISSLKEFVSGMRSARKVVHAEAASRVHSWDKAISSVLCSCASTIRDTYTLVSTRCKNSMQECADLISLTVKNLKPGRAPKLLQTQVSTFGKWTKQYLSQRWSSIKEERNYKHSGWMLSAVVTSGLVLIYMYLRMAGFWQYLVKRSYKPYRECVLGHQTLVREVLLSRGFGDFDFFHSFLFSEWPSAGPEIADLLFSAGKFFNNSDWTEGAHGTGDYRKCMMPGYMTKTFEQVETRLEAHGYYDAIQGDNCKEMYPNAMASNCELNDPIRDFEKSFFGLCILYFDAVVINSEWAMYMGFGIGLVLGINSLVSVLAQYKSLSLTLTDGVIDDEARPAGIQNYREKQRRAIERLQKLQLQYTKWSELIKVYPLNSTVMFFGILLSTAVLQLVVTGSVLTFLIGSLAALNEIYNLLHQVSSFIVAWIVISIVDSVVMQEWMVERVLTDNYRFKHPDIWILYTLVYTMLNLVLGILYAVWRLILLIVFSLARLTRLDRPLFPTMQKLDQGHNAFFSMVLMHYTIQRNSRNLRKTLDRRRLEGFRRNNNTPGGQTPQGNSGTAVQATVSTDGMSQGPNGAGSEMRPVSGFASFTSTVPSRNVLFQRDSINPCLRVDKSVQTSPSFMKWYSIDSRESSDAADETSPLIQIAQVPPKNLFRWLAMRKRDYAEGQQPCIATEDHTGYNVLEEHWDSLIPIERFRRACSENILDLHSLSEREILESLCGTGEEESNRSFGHENNAALTASNHTPRRDIPTNHGKSHVDEENRGYPTPPSCFVTNSHVATNRTGTSQGNALMSFGCQIDELVPASVGFPGGASSFDSRAPRRVSSPVLSGVTGGSPETSSSGPDLGQLASEALFGSDIFDDGRMVGRMTSFSDLEMSLSAPVPKMGQLQALDRADIDSTEIGVQTDPSAWRSSLGCTGREGNPRNTARQASTPDTAFLDSLVVGEQSITSGWRSFQGAVHTEGSPECGAIESSAPGATTSDYGGRELLTDPTGWRRFQADVHREGQGNENS